MNKINKKSKVNKQKNKKSKVIKRTRCNYDKANLKLAVEEVFNGKTTAEVSRKYNVPESTIRAKKQCKYNDKPPGPSTVLSNIEENELVEWIFYCCKQGFPITKQKLLDSVKLLCDSDDRKTPFVDNRPGRSWYEAFIKRHPQVSEIVSENLSVTRAQVTELGIRAWFQGIKNHLIEISTEEDILNIDPSRIFNANEISVSMNLKPSVLASGGTRDEYSIVSKNKKENITVLITANAAGNLVPTLLLFAGKSIPKDVIKVAPKNFSLGHSENGSMTAKTFYEYIGNVFFPCVVQNNIKLPIILYIDGLCPHVSLPLSQFCSENKIILIALHPNATDILQPLDVALFRTFPAAYQRSFQTLCENSGTISIKKSQVALVLQKTFESLDLKKMLENGFKTCGLHPLNADAIDYSKVFKKLTTSCYEIESSSTSEGTMPEISTETESLRVLESLIDEDTLRSFRANDSSIWGGRKEDESLFKIWFKLTKPTVELQREESEVQESNNQ
ncbi:Similar to TIGD1: Tigger transposable element-derived protein 1 (Homo sapiens) [Cotesia congregata]|uniref:Similar to TIGD1: Tigger transposable element-derived protein 1 (Homo sapiens) n=1 Tax=Cotesia congregata TaxID=51543 RepID=A0A8J2MAR0_COTCN|nr:Similar to TIGD1: Tigger transposable element-derived protein 1 (Homo sapiens) [Cotesia congregata]